MGVAAGDVGVIVNSEDFEFVETFGEDWETRWCHGPAKQDENGKPIRESLIHTKLIKYPLNPKDAKPCLQFLVRSGMQLCGGAGNLVRINNDGKIQNDKWNKVLLTINWDEKCVVAQVDTRGKGYVPAVQ